MWSLAIYGMLAFMSTGERWSKGEDCYRVSYEKDAVKYITDYNLNGKWRNTIRIYDESNLKNNIKQSIKTGYVHSDIILVNELNYAHKLVYFIKIRHDGWLKTVRITDNNMDVVEEFREM